MKNVQILLLVLMVNVIAGCSANHTFLGEFLSSPDTPSPALSADQPSAAPVNVLGWVENIHIEGIDYEPSAKLDSGAKTSSINASVIKVFEKDGKEHIVFRTRFDDDASDKAEQVFESEIKRWAKIKKKGVKGGVIRRPVVEMTFCLGDQLVTGEVNLAERGHFTYPVLIGRNMLSNNFVIDSAKTHTRSPSCAGFAKTVDVYQGY